MAKWKTFFFDGNQWSGVVGSPTKFRELLAAYAFDLTTVLGGKRAPVTEIAKIPAEYTVGAAARTRTGEMPSFGFRREHIGKQLLGDWMKDNFIDLGEAAPQ